MAKKKFSLDFSIERDVDRLEAVNNILDKLDNKPSNSDLELMANYLLNGKDEEGRNAVQRRELTSIDKRYNSFKKKSEKEVSLDEILDSELVPPPMKPLTERYVYLKKKQTIQRPKYDKQGNEIDPGDGDIPGMRDLWADIDDLTERVKEAEAAANDPTSNYRVYQMKHMLIDVRRNQYYLKDAYKPQIHPLHLISPGRQLIDWDNDSFYWISEKEMRARKPNFNIEEETTRLNDKGEVEIKWMVRRHNFDWENTKHIASLIKFYSDIYMQCAEEPFSWGRTLIYDFDRYVDMANLTPLRLDLLTWRIDKLTIPKIREKCLMKWGINYSESRLYDIFTNEIPRLMVAAAKRHRLLLETPEDKKKTCIKCHKPYPLHIIFFGKNSDRKDGFSNICHECAREAKKNVGTKKKGT